MKTSQHIDQEYKRLNIILLSLILLAMVGIAYLFWGKYQAVSPGSSTETTTLAQETKESSQETQEVMTTSSETTTSQETTTQEETTELEELTEFVTLDLPPVGTIQTGYHITDYTEGSQDRIEIRQAYQAALKPYSDLESLTETWIGYISPTETSATITDNHTGKTYLVLMQWVDGEGWQPTSITPQ